MTLTVIQDLKTPKKIKTKTKSFQYDSEQKENFRDYRFSILLYTQDRKLGNLGNCLLIQILTV